MMQNRLDHLNHINTWINKEVSNISGVPKSTDAEMIEKHKRV